MRIGLITSSFPRHDQDHAGRFVLERAHRLVNDGHRVDVLAPEPTDGGAGPPSWPGIRVGWVRYARPRALGRAFYGAGAPDNLGRDPVAWLGGAAFTAALAHRAGNAAPGWDLVESHWLVPAGWVGTLIAGGPGQPRHVAVAHSSDVAFLVRMPGGRRIAARIARRAQVLRFSHRGLQERFLDLLPARRRGDAAARSTVAPMPPSPRIRPPTPEERRRARSALGIEEDELVVLVAARLVPVKGVDVAIAAMAELPEGVRLVVAGDGPERPRLSRLAAPQGDRVQLLGHLAPDVLSSWRDAADAFLMTSRPLPDGRTEGAPVAVAEAVAAGLPVIATRTGGLPDQLAGVTHARLVPPEDPASVRRAVAALLDARAGLRGEPSGSRPAPRTGRSSSTRSG